MTNLGLPEGNMTKTQIKFYIILTLFSSNTPISDFVVKVYNMIVNASTIKTINVIELRQRFSDLLMMNRIKNIVLEVNLNIFFCLS